jgi:hypothetical protein
MIDTTTDLAVALWPGFGPTDSTKLDALAAGTNLHNIKQMMRIVRQSTDLSFEKIPENKMTQGWSNLSCAVFPDHR